MSLVHFYLVRIVMTAVAAVNFIVIVAVAPVNVVVAGVVASNAVVSIDILRITMLPILMAVERTTTTGLIRRIL